MWITTAFIAALAAVALATGFMVRIVSRLRSWSRRRAHFLAFSFCWVFYLPIWFFRESISIRFLPHSPGGLLGSIGGDFLAGLLMAVLAHMAGEIAKMGLSTEGHGAGGPVVRRMAPKVKDE